MHRLLVVFVFATACVATLAQGASARNPGGRDYGGAIFSAGVSGIDGPRTARLAPATALGGLLRVSDDSGLPDTLASSDLAASAGTEGEGVRGTTPGIFVNSQTARAFDQLFAKAMEYMQNPGTAIFTRETR